MVTATYIGRLAAEQLRNLYALKRDYSEKLQETDRQGLEAEERVISYADTLLTAMNLRGQDVAEVDTVPDPHPCSKNVLDILDDPDSLDLDYLELSNCCQRHVCRSDG